MEYFQLVSYPQHQEVWDKLIINDVGRITQVVHGWEISTNTVFFIDHPEVPRELFRDVTYTKL